MSILKTIKAQLGLSLVAINNFVFDASAQNGTMKLSRGNVGETVQDIINIDTMGNINTAGYVKSITPMCAGTIVDAAGQTDYRPTLTATFTTGGMNVTNVSGGRITVPVSGYYQIYAQQLISAGASAVYFMLEKNNVSQYLQAWRQNTMGDMVVSTILYLNAGDFINLHITGTVNQAWGGAHSSFYCRMV